MSTHTLVSPASAPGSAYLHPEEAAAKPAAEAATDNIATLPVCLFVCVFVLQFSVNWHLGPLRL